MDLADLLEVAKCEWPELFTDEAIDRLKCKKSTAKRDAPNARRRKPTSPVQDSGDVQDAYVGADSAPEAGGSNCEAAGGGGGGFTAAAAAAAAAAAGAGAGGGSEPAAGPDADGGGDAGSGRTDIQLARHGWPDAEPPSSMSSPSASCDGSS